VHEFLSKRLWIGHRLDLRDPTPLFDLGIAAVVDVALEERPEQLPRELIYCRYPLNDGGGNDPAVVSGAIRCVTGLLEDGVKTMIACSAGASRSPTIAAFAMAAHSGQSPEDVIEQAAANKRFEISAAFWRDVLSVFSAAGGGDGD